MNQPATLGMVVAFVAGLLSFLSPCVLPLVPSYIGFLTGMTLPELGNRRRAALLHALLFVAGFSLVFILLGASATALGRALAYYQVWLQRAGGVLIILFGLLCLGVLSVPGLLTERRLQLGDLRLLGCVFRSCGEVVDTGAGGAVMGDPAAAVAWLVNVLAGRGEHLPAGSVVLSGGLTASVGLKSGANVVAEFDGLGSVDVHT